MAIIAILHPGEMGTAVGAALRKAGHDVGWLPAGRGAATARRAEQAGLVELVSPTGVDVVISVCPPDAAAEVARSVAGFDGIFVDANAISPSASQAIGASFACYVDGSVIGPPPTKAETSRLYLSGARADEVAALFAGSPLEAIVLPGEQSASALKMAYAGWTKVSAALLLTTHEAAARLGVADALAAEWSRSQPALADRLESARASAEAKGWRWTGEMREIAATLRDAGLPDGFGLAAAQVYGDYPRP